MQNSDISPKLEKTMEVLAGDLKSLRVGRANAGMVEDIPVDAYDSKMPLQQVASVSIPQNNQILIQPWDAALVGAVQNAIRQSDMNVNPVVEGNSIRITLPPVTEERRKELAKEAHKFGESARISMRNIREEALKDLDDAEKNKEISEDEKFKQKEALQDMINAYNKKVEEAIDGREREILEQ
ncbi:MAG: ribosome recycling factor [Candidatus Spechtbacterales bacterium]